MEAQVKVLKELKTYSRLSKSSKNNVDAGQPEKTYIPLTCKDATSFLLSGTLRLQVCRYCLHIAEVLSEIDEILVVAGKGGLYEVTIKDIIASFYPLKVTHDTNFPNKICNKCLNQALNCFLFAQQCEQSERALRNYFEDMDEKFDKLDPIEPVKRRGKRKLNPNHNILYAEHLNVIDYADPIINLVNIDALPQETTEDNELECSKCWQVLPNKVSLVNHEKSHPKTMWYNCKQCGKSFVKYYQLKKHKRLAHKRDINIEKTEPNFTCQQCGVHNEDLEHHLTHIEKHKFQRSLNNFINRNTTNMCSVCLSEDNDNMRDMKETMHLHGGYPALTGPKSIYDMVSSVFPDITLACHSGSKICKHCLNKLITTYIFTFSVKNIRNRLDMCISSMINDLNNVEGDKNIIIEIGEDAIMPAIDFKNSSTIEENFTMEVDVLEDEFRVSTESDSESDESEFKNLARNATKTYGKMRLVNGFQNHITSEYFDDTEYISFERHYERTKKPCRYTCPVCYKKFISDYFLKKHILRHTPKGVNCKQCTQQFKSKFYLIEHMKMAHLLKIDNYSSCNKCGRGFKDLRKLKKHFKLHFNVQCQLCDKYFLTQVHFDRHMQRHAIKLKRRRPTEVLTCSFCEKACSSETSLSLHVNKVHLSMKPYSCDMCDKQFYTEHSLNCHKPLHSMYSQEECEFCHKVFKCRKNLVVHLRKHINIRPHYCLVCSQSFYSESSLKRHMKIFHGGRFCCRLCKTVVDSNTDLKNHIKVAHSCM